MSRYFQIDSVYTIMVTQQAIMHDVYMSLLRLIQKMLRLWWQTIHTSLFASSDVTWMSVWLCLKRH